MLHAHKAGVLCEAECENRVWARLEDRDQGTGQAERQRPGHRQGWKTDLSCCCCLVSKQVSVVLAGEGLGLHQEVSQVVLEGSVVLQLKHACHTRLHRQTVQLAGDP